MYTYFNPNPTGRHVGDCSVRAIAKALGISWDDAYRLIADRGYEMGDVPSSDAVWGAVLKNHGFYRNVVPNICPQCYTAAEFARAHPDGVYVLGFGNHVATIIDGDIYDTWDSSQEIPVYYWHRNRR